MTIDDTMGDWGSQARSRLAMIAAALILSTKDKRVTTSQGTLVTDEPRADERDPIQEDE
jgi:hypothetical protein